MIRSNPTGAAVYIDGIERGSTDLLLRELPPGEYAVRLQKEGYEERRFRVTLRQGSRLVLLIELEESRGQIVIQIKRAPGSPPESALSLNPIIIVDGEIATGPLLSLPIGYRTIKIQAFGWKEESRTIYVVAGDNRFLEFELSTAPLSMRANTLRRSRFNPRNAGALGRVELGFQVSAPGIGTVAIYNSQGNLVYSRELAHFSSQFQELFWDGRSALGEVLPDGSYTAIIQGESIPWDGSDPVRPRLELSLIIDSTIKIRPLSLGSGIPGLALSPMAEVLPQGAFQVEGALLFGQPPELGSPWEAMPFSGGIRAAIINSLELAAAVNVAPRLESGAASAVGGSVRYQIRKPGIAPGTVLSAFAFGAGLYYGWVEGGSASPFGLTTGIQAFLPVSASFALKRNAVGALGLFPGQSEGESPGFTFQLTPALLWTGDQGYPSEPAPRIHLSGGLLFQYSFLLAGISARAEFRFDRGWEEVKSAPGWAGPLVMAAEIRAYPPPSSFVFTVLGGLWIRGSEHGAFGGAGIGLIY